MYAKGTDTIPAMLTPGEYVVKKQAVDFYGPEVMRAINNMQVPKRFFTASGQMQNGPQVSGMAANGQRVTVDLSPSSVQDRKSTRLNSSHVATSYAVFCSKKKTRQSKRPAKYREQ